MATETIIAPAPPGVQSTFERPLGPQPSKSGRAEKYHKAFAELTQADIKPKETVEPSKPDLEKGTEIPTTAQGQSQPDTEKKAEPVPSPEKPTTKPESPLDAVLAKPKEPEKVEEPDVLKEFDEKTANWQRAREVMKTQSSELKALREEIKQAKASPKVEPSVIEELTRQRDELQDKFQRQEEKLKGLSYTYSDEFQTLVTARENDVAKLSERVAAYGGDAKAIIAALALPEGIVRANQIEQALDQVGEKNRGRIERIIERIEEHDEKIIDAQKDSPRRWEQLQAQREAQLAEQSQSAIKQLEAEFGKVSETIPSNSVTLREVPDDVPGGTEWNQEIKAARENALRVLKPNGADFNESVAVAMKGARYDSLEKRYLSLHSDYSELKQKYNEAVGAGPDFKGGGQPKTDVKKSAPKKYHETLAAIKSGQMGEF